MKYFLLVIFLWTTGSANAQGIGGILQPTELQQPLQLVEPFTAYTLTSGEIQVGLDHLYYGLDDMLTITHRPIELLMGMVTGGAKWQLTDVAAGQNLPALLSLGLDVTYLHRDLLLPFLKENVADLSGTVLKPQLIFSKNLSRRLIIHSYLAFAWGDSVNISLTPEGRENHWSDKHDDPYPYRDGASDNRGENTSTKRDKINIDSFDLIPLASSMGPQGNPSATGLFNVLADEFILAGEIRQNNHRSIMVEFKASSARLEDMTYQAFSTVAGYHLLFANTFHLRPYIGFTQGRYYGTDLDSERIDAVSTGFNIGAVAYFRFHP